MAHNRIFTNKLLLFAAASVVALANAASGQTVSDTLQAAKNAPAAKVTVPAAPAPALNAYKDVSIGMTADDVQEKWGKPKVSDKDGFLYEFSGSHTAQVKIDADKKVSAIAIMFTKKDEAPSLNEIFGEGAKADTDQNGTIFKMVRYPEAGYWVSYFSGSGDHPMITLTIQKM